MEIAIAITGLAVSVMGFFLGRYASIKSAGREDGEMLTEIKHIKEGIESIQNNLSDMREEILSLRDRVTRLETLNDVKTGGQSHV